MNADFPFIRDFKARGMAVLQDDGGGLRQAALIAPAQNITAQQLNLMLTWGRGLPFVALSPARAEAFMLFSMSRPRTRAGQFEHNDVVPRMYVSVDAREGATTGISASDRALALRILGEKKPKPAKLVRPGHVFPVETKEGGVLVRNTIPEGALDVVRIAGFTDAAFFLDLLDEGGGIMDGASQQALAAAQALPFTSLSALTAYRLQHEKLVVRLAEAKLPTASGGQLRSFIYRSTLHGGEHLALVKGEVRSDRPVLARVQMESTAADVFGGPAPTRRQIHACLAALKAEECGVLLYLRRTAGGFMHRQIEALQHPRALPAPLHLREYGLGAQILYDLGVRKIKLLSNSGADLSGLESFGLEVVSQQPLPPAALE